MIVFEDGVFIISNNRGRAKRAPRGKGGPDSQRQSAYAAETVAECRVPCKIVCLPFEGKLHACAALLDRVVCDKRWRYGGIRFLLAENGRISAPRMVPSKPAKIELCRSHGESAFNLAHELAHVVAGDSSPDHGAVWAGIMLDVTGLMMGTKGADCLRDLYNKKGVHYV